MIPNPRDFGAPALIFAQIRCRRTNGMFDVANKAKSERHALKSLPQQRKAMLAALDASIVRGITDAEAGRLQTVRQVFDRLESKYRGAATASRDDRRK